MNNIAEGSGKKTAKSKMQFYSFSLDSARECIPMITLLFNQKVINEETCRFLREECIGICRMLGKLIGSTNEKKKV